MNTKQISWPLLMTVVLLVILALFTAAGLAQAEAAGDPYAYLRTYEFGQNRAPLYVIEQAVNAAAAEKAGAEDAATVEKKLCAALDAGCTLEAKRFICRQLKAIGHEACVPALEKLLAAPETLQAALTALESNPTDAAADAILGAVQANKDRAKIAAVASLGRQASKKAAPALVGLLTDADTAVVEQAALSLGELKDAAGCAALFDTLKKAAADKRALYTDGCFQCAQAEGLADKAEWLAYLNGPDFPGYVRVAALGGLVKLNPEKAPALIVAALNDADPEIAQVALGLARQTKGEEITKALADALKGAAPEQQIALLDILAARQDAVGLDTAITLADSADAKVAVAALRAIGRLGNADSVSFLVKHAATASGDVRTAAQESLATLAGKGVDGALEKIARGGDEENLRVAAIRSLGERRAFSTTPALLDLAKSKQDAVRAESLKSLRVLAKDSDMDDLLALLKDTKDSAKQDDVIRAIVALCERNLDADHRADAVIAALDKAKDDSFQAALIGTLGRIGTGPALDVLRNRLDKSSGDLRAAVIDAMASWPTGAPVDDMLAILKAPKDDKERSKAFDGYVRILRLVDTESASAVTARYREAAQLAANPTEKKAVLSGVANVASLDALDLADELGQDPDLAAESRTAAMRIAEAVYGADPEGIRARMEKVLANQPGEGAKRQATTILDRINGFGDYISAWEVAGPYFVEGKGTESLFDIVFPPETDDAHVGWHVMPMGLEDARSWVALLDKVIGGENRVAYLRTRIWSPDARDVIIELGTNDGCKVWFNNALIHTFKDGRGLLPGQDKLPVKLQQGWNTLLVGVCQMGGAWSACARVTQPDGSPAQGLRFSTREK